MQWWIQHEGELRLVSFASFILIMGVWEKIYPRRSLTQSWKKRWLHNFLLVFINTLLLRLVFPMLAVEVAIRCFQNQMGIAHWLNLPVILNILLSVILLDFFIYLQHRVFHKVPLLWRLHRVHHTDLDLDVSSGSRFHTIEIILSMGIKMALVILLGVHPVAVIIFEIILSSMALFNHANAKLPQKVDGLLRKWIVTPDLHRIHHSQNQREQNSNFGFNLSLWDRWLGTIKDESMKPPLEFPLGVENFPQNQCVLLHRLLVQPFKSQITEQQVAKD